MRAFIEKHCADCHDSESQKGGLDLTGLAFQLDDPRNFAKWVKAFDKIESGEMPPKKKARPPQAETTAVLEWLNSALITADTKRVKEEGRALLRRMTRTEYENTVQDLLAIDIPLRDLLPEDAAVEGFEKVDEGLRLSPVHLERYLEAARQALTAAVVIGSKPVTKTHRLSYKDSPSIKKEIGKGLIARADDVVFLDDVAESERAALRNIFRVTQPGRYRVRVSASGYQTGGKPMTLHIGAKTFNPAFGKAKLGAYFDVPEDKPTVVETTGFVSVNGTIAVAGYNLTKTGVKDVKTYKGPGLAIQWVEVEGPLAEEWPPASYTGLFGKLELEKGTLSDAQKILHDFLPRAFRRAVADDEAAPFVALVKSKLGVGTPFQEAIRTALAAVLCSPDFLMHRQLVGRLDSSALASRLSYFLWNSMPDAELLALGVNGQITQPAVLRAQTERLLNDPKVERFVNDFTGQWLETADLSATLPDKLLYPEHDGLLQSSMGGEVHSFFSELLRANLPVENFISSDFTMLNGRLAKHYNIPGVEGQEFQKVTLPPGSHRGGLMTMAAILKVTANGTATSPVVRGKWVLDRLMGRPPEPPPPNVPAIEPDTRGAHTIRELLAKHRDQPACASCHAMIDPPGFALESFDVIGTWREKYRMLPESAKTAVNAQRLKIKFIQGLPVDPSGELPDGRKFANIDDFKKLLLVDKLQFTKGLASRLLVYATGHKVEFFDRAPMGQIAARTTQQGGGLRTLVHEFIQSPSFQNK
ncbi:MAG: DUF1592 domain-containing protein [Planctomycetota bacterium]